MDIEKLYQIFCRFPVISTDTRKSVGNSIFFALRGEKFNGNLYAEEALRKGAQCIIADDNIAGSDKRIILVKDTLSTLQQLAAFHRSKINTNIIAVTGSNGKTTTKDLIYKVLSLKYKVCSTQGNLNNHIGVPLTILNIKSEDQFGVVEMGANHPGEIRNLCGIARPGYGLITNIGRAHLEGFGSFEGVKKAKQELYAYLQDSNGKVFVNCGDKVLMELLRNFTGEMIQYGKCEGSICSGEIIDNNPFLNMHVNVGNDNVNQSDINTRIAGDFNLENILAALTVGFYFDVNVNSMITAIRNYVPDQLRSQMVKTKSNTLFVDAYNANPTSMEAAIRNFQNYPGKNKILIIGEMAELGQASSEEHFLLISLLSQHRGSRIILVGKNFFEFSIPPEFERFPDTQTLIQWLQTNPLRNSTILLKGSRIVGLEKLIPTL
jgi:UDP-N-acetylmuramoyl-tripeptide--D-alanyl-D-alanine ligase